MNINDLLTTPGLDDVRIAYAGMCELEITPLVAHDWLIEHVHAVTREDVAHQLARNDGQPATAPYSVTEYQTADMMRAVGMAMSVYNQRRSRITEFDGIATARGAAEVNRAAIIRQTRTKNEAYARLGEVSTETISVGNGPKRRYFVSSTLIIGDKARAMTARFTRKTEGARAYLDRWAILMP